MDTTHTKQLALVNKEISEELKDTNVAKALLATTFKGLTEPLMKQAIFEGMIRGFSFKNFLQKDVYALPYGGNYSLVTSIDFARKQGAMGGVIGKSKPTFEMATDPKAEHDIISCDVTVHKKGGHPDGYTATVYFDEYYKPGKNNYPSLWDSKPRTMIAKVAEMHALRMACPEQLAKIYVAEELEKEEYSFDRDGIDEDTVVTTTGVDEDVVIPTTETERRVYILKELKRLDPSLDTSDKKAIATAVADLTQLEYKPENYGNIIHLLLRAN